MVPLKKRADKKLDAFDVKWRYNTAIQFDELFKQFENEKRKDDTSKDTTKKDTTTSLAAAKRSKNKLKLEEKYFLKDVELL